MFSLRLMSHVIIIVSPTSTTYPTDFQLVAELKAASPGALGSLRSLLLRHLLRRKQRTVTLSGVAARHGTGGSHSLISTGYCLRTNRSWFRILLVMLGAHLVSTQAPGSEGGITDNEPNALQPRNPFPKHERSLSSVHTAPASAESLAVIAEPKTLLAAAAYGGGAVQLSEGRPAQRAVESKLLSAFHQANFYFIAAAFLALTGMM